MRYIVVLCLCCFGLNLGLLHLVVIHSLSNAGSQNIFVGGPHKLLQVEGGTCDCFGICHILPNQQIFRKYIFSLTKCLRGPDEMVCGTHLAHRP